MMSPRLLGFWLVCTVALVPAAEKIQGPANVPLITIDTLRADRLGCYGYGAIQTPHIDRLARDGILFKNCIVQAPLTLPSHATILTGTYPQYHAVQDNIGFVLGKKNIPSLAMLLRDRGYATAAFVGSYVLDHSRGLDRGFEAYFDRMERVLADEIDFRVSLAERRGDKVTQEAIQWLSERRGRKFFGWIHLYDPHEPYQAPEPYRSLYAGRPYDGEVAYVDELIGQIVVFLQQQKLYDDTLLIVTGDHGESLGEHGEPFHGYFLYDAVLKVPLIIKPPAGAFRGAVVESQVRSVDIAPTILAYLRFPTPGEVQGKQLISRLVQKETAVSGEPAYAENFAQRLQFGWSELKSLRTDRYKYIQSPKPEFYDLANDPGETTSIFESQRALASRLDENLRKEEASYVDRSASAPAPRVSLEQLQKLQSLGYIGAPGALRTRESSQFLPDPKDKLQIYKLLTAIIHSARKGIDAASLKSLLRLVEREPRSTMIYNILGLHELRLMNYDRAQQYFKKATALLPDHPLLVYNLAFTYYKQGAMGAAQAGFERVLQLDPNHYEACNNLGNCFRAKGNLAEAVQRYQRALAIDPEYVYAHNNLGEVYFSQGKTLAAITEYQRAIRAWDRFVPAHSNLGDAYASRAQFEGAILSYNRTLELDPERYGARYNLGLIYKKRSQWKEAAQAFLRLVQGNPKDAAARYNLGEAYLNLNRRAEAEKEFAEACRLDPELCRAKRTDR